MPRPDVVYTPGGSACGPPPATWVTCPGHPRPLAVFRQIRPFQGATVCDELHGAGRESCPGRTFGVRAAGGGYSQVVPMEVLNLHLTRGLS